jgi:hypothetical protein
MHQTIHLINIINNNHAQIAKLQYHPSPCIHVSNHVTIFQLIRKMNT